jgi:hypothetical protein
VDKTGLAADGGGVARQFIAPDAIRLMLMLMLRKSESDLALTSALVIYKPLGDIPYQIHLRADLDLIALASSQRRHIVEVATGDIEVAVGILGH